jgi:hypothetical protein
MQREEFAKQHSLTISMFDDLEANAEVIDKEIRCNHVAKFLMLITNADDTPTLITASELKRRYDGYSYGRPDKKNHDELTAYVGKLVNSTRKGTHIPKTRYVLTITSFRYKILITIRHREKKLKKRGFTRKFLKKQNIIKEYLINVGVPFTQCDSTLTTKAGERRYRPDFLIDAPDRAIIIEIDEGKHKSYNEADEERRMKAIGYILFKKTIFIRFNPDDENGNLAADRFDSLHEVIEEEMCVDMSTRVAISSIRCFYEPNDMDFITIIEQEFPPHIFIKNVPLEPLLLSYRDSPTDETLSKITEWFEKFRASGVSNEDPLASAIHAKDNYAISSILRILQ